MNLQPTLENELVLVRPLLENDKDTLFQVARDPLIWEQHPAKERAEPEGFSKFFKESTASGGAFIIFEKSSGQAIGSTRFKHYPQSPDAVEIGWSVLARKYWGGKYNGSIKKLLIDYAFQHRSFVILYIARENIRSQKAAEKIGASLAQTPQHQHMIRKEKDTLTFIIDREVWNGQASL